MSYLNQPKDQQGMPSGIPFIVSNEAAERFSYYGMRAILMVYMTEYLRNGAGQLAPMGETEALFYYHLFTSSAYLFPFFGALLADVFLGKYRTILSLSLMYCFGHGALALADSGWGVSLGLAPQSWLLIGLTLIAIGAGGIKPCVSAHVGDQFGKSNAALLPRVFAAFYFSINLGAALAMALIPWLLEEYGPSVAFGLPGFLMALATLVFWSGRNRFVHIPAGGKQFVEDLLGREGLRALGKLVIIYVFVAIFWSLFDQTGSSWVMQAKRMDRVLFGTEVLAAQVQAVNPLLIMGFVPLFSAVIYPAVDRIIPLTPLRKISFGLFVATGSFLLSALIEVWLANGTRVSIAWQILAFAVITAAEVMVSVTCLEFSYTQAPNRMKSLVMGLFYLSVWLGNLITSLINFALKTEQGGSRISGPGYYWLFAAIMAAAATGFIAVSRRYRPVLYIQGSA